MHGCPLNEAATDADGRCKYLLPRAQALRGGRSTGCSSRQHATMRHTGLKGLYPYVEIVFEIRDSEQHYHIPLLLTANGYTTYRGS